MEEKWKGKWHGVFAIPATPFTDSLAVDAESYVEQLDWLLACGVQGIVYPILASEFFTLDDDERRHLTRLTVERVAGRVPVVVGVTGVSTPHTLKLAAHARDLGADAIILMPPTQAPLGTPAVIEYYRTVAASVQIPVCIQNAPPPVGSPIPVASCVQLVREVDNITLLKEETPVFTHHMSALAAHKDVVQGIFGGLGGLHFPEELRRGATGTMPGALFPDALVRFWNLWESGDTAGAELLFARLLPMIVTENLLKTALIKEALVARGIIRSAALRNGMPPLDDYDRAVLRQRLAALDDLLIR